LQNYEILDSTKFRSFADGFLGDPEEQAKSAMTTIRAGGLPAASLGSIFEASPQPMLVVEPNENRIVDANRAACRLLGYDRELLRSLKFTDLHPGQRPALIVFTQAVMAKGSFWSHSLAARMRPDTSSHWNTKRASFPDRTTRRRSCSSS
jgi:PAS domain-containing protein